jgi:hypothetical protein
MKLTDRPSRARTSRDTVDALTTSPLSVLTTRPTCRVGSPRRNASRISIASAGARRCNGFTPAGRKLFPRTRAIRSRIVPNTVAKSRS